MHAIGRGKDRHRPFVPAVQSESCQQFVGTPASGEHGGAKPDIPWPRCWGQTEPEVRWLWGARAVHAWIPPPPSMDPVAASPTWASTVSAVRGPQPAVQPHAASASATTAILERIRRTTRERYARWPMQSTRIPYAPAYLVLRPATSSPRCGFPLAAGHVTSSARRRRLRFAARGCAVR